jgi:hypothetical protein
MSEHRFKKGESGNPKGRPKSLFNWQRAIAEKAAERHPTDYKERTWGQRVVENLFKMAADGRTSQKQLNAIRELLDRGMGKAVQAMAIADMRPESREQLVESLFQIARASQDDDKLPVQ